MPNVQQPEMRRGGETRLVQDSDGPRPPRRRGGRAEHRPVPPEQVSPYGTPAPAGGKAQQPHGRDAEGN